MELNFNELWGKLPTENDLVWKAIEPTGHRNQIRSTLELLCSALWHLELAYAIGEFLKEKMFEYRDKLVENDENIPWEIWRTRLPKVEVEFSPNEQSPKTLDIKYEFCKPSMNHSNT